MKSKLAYCICFLSLASLLFTNCSKETASVETKETCVVTPNTFNVNGNKLAQFTATDYVADSNENTISINAYSVYGSFNKYMFLKFAGTSLPKPGTYTGSNQMANSKLKSNEVWIQYWGDMNDIRSPQNTCTVHVAEANGRITISFCNAAFSAAFSSEKYNCSAAVDVLR